MSLVTTPPELPNLIGSGEGRQLVFSAGISEEEPSVARRCMTHSPWVSRNRGGSISTPPLLDIRSTVDDA
jgi:hypothetical protein